MTYDPYRPQATPKAPWELDGDHRRALALAVHNNQLQMALYHVPELVAEFDRLFARVEARLLALEENLEKLLEVKTAVAEDSTPTRVRRVKDADSES